MLPTSERQEDVEQRYLKQDRSQMIWNILVGTGIIISAFIQMSSKPGFMASQNQAQATQKEKKEARSQRQTQETRKKRSTSSTRGQNQKGQL